MGNWNLSICTSLDSDTLNLYFEGVMFPLDDVLAALHPLLQAESTGKIDCCDLEKWTMTRAVFHGQEIRIASANLDNVMAYSGF